MRRLKQSIIMLCFFLLFTYLSFPSRAAGLCPLTNKTNASISAIGNNEQVAIIFDKNITNNWIAVDVLNAGSDFSIVIFNATSKMFNTAENNITFPYSTRGSSANSFMLAASFNGTGQNATELAVIALNEDLSFIYWNGTNFTNNTRIPVQSAGFAGGNDADLIWLTKFPTSDKSTLFGTNGSQNGMRALVYNNSAVYLNNSLTAGLGSISGTTSLAAAFNLTENNTWNIITQDSAAANTNFFSWNGSSWVNTTIKDSSSVTINTINGMYFVFNFTTSLTNWTVFGHGASQITTALSGYSRYGNIFYNTSFYNESVAAGKSVNVSFGIISQCGVRNFTFETNISGANANISTFTSLNKDTTQNQSQNITIGTKCRNILGFTAYLIDYANDIYSFTGTATGIFPLLFNQTGTLASVLNLSCKSGTNATIVWNNTINANATITLNMSGIMFGNNQTCFYRANNVSQLRAVNKTSGCEVMLVNANAGGNITVEQAVEFGAERGGNLGVAIAAGSAAAIVIAYVIARRRRAEE